MANYLKKINDDEDFNVWPIFSDVTFAIILILIFIMLGQYVVIGKMLEIQKISKEQKLLSNKLKEAFPNSYGTAIKDFTQPQLQKIIFSDKILFDTGSDSLKSEGKTVLHEIAKILNSIRQRRAFDEIQVRGHRDDRTIGRALRKKFPSNWELSAARAISVVRFFVDECHLNPSKVLLVSAQGFAQFDPISDNETDEGRAMNRRIEILIKYPFSL